MTATLPSFRRPPVHEVALAVQFESDQPLISADLAGMRALLRPEYPKVREQPPLGRMVVDQSRSIEFEFSNTPPVPRFWFVSADESHLVQLQSDRMVVNWRRQGEEQYPRYKTIRPRLQQAWGSFMSLLSEFGYSEPRPDVAEVLYVNPIEAVPGIWDRPSELGAVFEPWSGRLSDPTSTSLVSAGLNLQFAMSGVDGGLTAKVEPATNNKTGRAAFMLTLTARGRVEDGTFDGALRFLDSGHTAIVETFTALTTETMHTHWEREQ